MDHIVMQQAARIAADLVVILHAGYVTFVLVGQILILIGWLRRWQWVTNIWFRGTHLIAIVIVVLESWFGIICPLTTLEHWLRVRGGQASYRGDFLGNIVHELLFVEWEPWVFTAVYTLFSAIVLLSIWIVPPRRKKRVVQN